MVKIGDRYRPRYIDAKKILSHSRVWFLSFVIDKKYSRCVIDKIKKKVWYFPRRLWGVRGVAFCHLPAHDPLEVVHCASMICSHRQETPLVWCLETFEQARVLLLFSMSYLETLEQTRVLLLFSMSYLGCVVSPLSTINLLTQNYWRPHKVSLTLLLL